MRFLVLLRETKKKALCFLKPKDSIALNKLTPEIHEQDNAIYVKKIISGIEDPDVKNIALLGGYGTGKSSILLQLKQKYKKDIKTISFLTIKECGDNDFEQDNKIKQSGSETKTIENQIQTEIFKQLYYGEKPSTISQTKYIRIGKSWSWTKCISITAVLVAIAVCFGIVTDTINTRPFDNLFNGNNILIMVAWTIIVVLIVLVLKYLSLFLYRHPIGKISAFDLSADLLDNKADFEQMVDEIIYIFKKSKYNVVVFEDLDRFKDVEIIEELRQLNYLINKSRLIKKKITFIYPIRDELISSTNMRVKLFDLIIPVIPFMADSNKDSHIISEFANIGLNLSEEKSVVAVLAKWIGDMRELRYVKEAYQTYTDITNKNLNLEPLKKELLGLAMIRVYYPEEISPNNKDSELQKLFIESSKRWLDDRSKIVDDLDLSKKIQKTEYTLFDAIKHDFESKYGETNKKAIVLVWKNNIYVPPYKELDQETILQEIENGQTLIARRQNNTTQTIEINRNYSNVNTGDITRFLNNIKHDTKFYRESLAMFESTSKFSYISDSKEPTTDFKKFIIDLVEAGMLSEDYSLYVTKMKYSGQSKSILTYKTSFLRYGRVLYDQPSLSKDDADCIIEGLTRSDYDNPALYNFQIIEFLCNRNQEKLNLLVHSARNNLDQLMNFLDAYCAANKNHIADYFGDTVDGSLLDKGVYFVNGNENINEPILIFIAVMSHIYPKQTFTHILKNIKLNHGVDKETYFNAALMGYDISNVFTFDEDMSLYFQGYFYTAIINKLDIKICSIMANNGYAVPNVEIVQNREAIECLVWAKNFNLTSLNIGSFNDEQLTRLLSDKKLDDRELIIVANELANESPVAAQLLDQVQDMTKNRSVYNALCNRLIRNPKEYLYDRIIKIAKNTDEFLVIKLALKVRLTDDELITILSNTSDDLSTIKDEPSRTMRKRQNMREYKVLAKRLENIGIISSWEEEDDIIKMRISKNASSIIEGVNKKQ